MEERLLTKGQLGGVCDQWGSCSANTAAVTLLGFQAVRLPGLGAEEGLQVEDEPDDSGVSNEEIGTRNLEEVLIVAQAERAIWFSEFEWWKLA
jgi:hypothetical protein